MKRKSLYLLLTGTLLATSLMGCNDTTTSNSSENTSEEATTNPPSEPETEKMPSGAVTGLIIKHIMSILTKTS